MDIHALKKGIVLSKNEPFLKQNKKNPTNVNPPNITFNIPSQLNTHQASNRERPLLDLPLNKNNQPYQHHSHKNSLDLNCQKPQEVSNVCSNQINTGFSTQRIYMPPFLSQNNLQLSQPFDTKSFNCAQTVVSTQDSFIVGKDFQELKCADKSHNNYNSTIFLNDYRRSQNDNLSYQLQQQRSKLLAQLSQSTIKNSELTKEVNILKHKNQQNASKVQHLEVINQSLLCKIKQISNSEDKRILKVKQSIQKQYHDQLLILKHELDQNKKVNQSEKQQFAMYEAQKQDLQQMINDKMSIIRMLEGKLVDKDKQLQDKISFYEMQIRKYQGNKNRLQIDAQNCKKLFKLQRQKNQKQKNEINKLLFFEEDLINAKDYQELKQENLFLRSQNQKMYEQHQNYINQTTQHRQSLQVQIFKMSIQIKNLNKQTLNDRSKLNRYLQNNDKLLLIKIQNDYNFMNKQFQQVKIKNEELLMTIKNKEEEINDLRLMISENKKVSQERKMNVMDQMNIKNIQNTIAMYEARLQDIGESFKAKDSQNQKNKRTLDYLTCQLRKAREDKNISFMKQANSQNNLKNDIISLKRTHQVELNIIQKKLCNLQDLLQRKNKQLLQKDTFINKIILEKARIDNSYKQAFKNGKKDDDHNNRSKNVTQGNATRERDIQDALNLHLQKNIVVDENKLNNNILCQKEDKHLIEDAEQDKVNSSHKNDDDKIVGRQRGVNNEDFSDKYEYNDAVCLKGNFPTVGRSEQLDQFNFQVKPIDII